MHKLSLHQKKRNLVSIRRSQIDDNAIQGFVLASSDELVVLQYVYDFTLDGLMALRVTDISEVRCSATNKFQKKLLAQEDLVKKVPFEAVFDLSSWRSLISQLAKEHAVLILEREGWKEKDMFIGQVLKTTATGVEGLYFTGAARWAEGTEKLKFKDITCCRVDTNYINVYQRYFEQHPP